MLAQIERFRPLLIKKDEPHGGGEDDFKESLKSHMSIGGRKASRLFPQPDFQGGKVYKWTSLPRVTKKATTKTTILPISHPGSNLTKSVRFSRLSIYIPALCTPPSLSSPLTLA